jgi:hypothetical protein
MSTAQSGPAGALALSEKSSQISFNDSSLPLCEIGQLFSATSLLIGGRLRLAAGQLSLATDCP